MSSGHSSRFGYVMLLALLVVLMVWSGIAPADRTVWMVESVWSTGLLVAPVGGRSAGDGPSELNPNR